MVDVYEVFDFISSEIKRIETNRKITFTPMIAPIFQLAILDSLSDANLAKRNTEEVTSRLKITFENLEGEITKQPYSSIFKVSDLMSVIHLRWCNVFPFCKTLDK
jgi:hypothetical protein